MSPINLKDLFGNRYRVTLDESARHEPGAKADPWHYLIPCRYGSISPFSEELLAFYCTARGIRTRLHREHPELEVQNWSDDGEAIFLFRPDQIELVAEYAKPRRKRRLSADHREKLTKAGTEALRLHKNSILNATKTAQNVAISDDSTQTMARIEIGDSGDCSPHFRGGGAT